MSPPEGLVVAAVVAALVADNCQQLVPLPAQDPAQGKALGERHLGRVLGGAAPVENGPRQMNGNDLGEDGNAHMPRDLALRRELRRWQRYPFQFLFGVGLQCLLNPRYFHLQMLQLVLRLGLCLCAHLDLKGMLQAALIAPEVIDVLRLEEAVKAGAQSGRARLWDLQGEVHKRGLIRLVLVVAERAFDLRLQLPLKGKAVLVVDLFQLRVYDGR